MSNEASKYPDPHSPVHLLNILFIKIFQHISAVATRVKSSHIRAWFSLKIRLWALVGFLAIVAIVFVATWLPAHSEDPDLGIKIVNFLVAWLPAVISIFAAFIPDLEKMRVGWRVFIIIFGLLYSILLWQQQSLTLTTSRIDQEKAIKEAVTQSNQHSDEQISSVKKQLESSTKSAAEQITGVANELAKLVSKSTSALTERIDKVKPPPPDLAKLQFSFHVKDTTEFPLTVQSVKADANNLVAVGITVRNTSSVTAKQGDIWIQICDLCKYAKEVKGLIKEVGSDEHIRHKRFERLNPGVFLENTPVEIIVPPQIRQFEIALDYAWENCMKGLDWEQKMSVLVMR